MPYSWFEDAAGGEMTLTLRPHQSLSAHGFAFFVLATFVFTLVPLIGLLGTSLLWALLPFSMISIVAIWIAVRRNQRDASIYETLVMDESSMTLTRHSPNGQKLRWICNPYWARVALHASGGPVPNYVTLLGNGREVEIGAFLSEDERLDLYDELRRRLPPTMDRR